MTVIPASSGTNTGASLDPPRGASGATPRDPFVAPVRPAAPPAPKRDSYLEEQYRWKPTDSFAAISTRYYSTDKYAAALQKYNRDYPLASPAMRQNPPMISPGQMIWIPPARILERDYGADIQGLEPVVAPRSAQPQVEPVGPPPGLNNSGFGNAAPQPYKVRDPGESLQEIARRTMGDSTQSLRIRSLNPTLSPDARLPIPAGTVLRLPAEARVEARDRP